MIRRTATVLTVCLITSCILSACNTRPSQPRSITGSVVKIHDGDSIHVKPAGRKRVIVRLSGIDAPELEQPYGYESRDYLRQQILNKNVRAECSKIDRYKRSVCSIILNGADINLAMLTNGYAWHYKHYAQEQPGRQRTLYSDAELSARESKLGLWQQRNPSAPWNFRQR